MKSTKIKTVCIPDLLTHCVSYRLFSLVNFCVVALLVSITEDFVYLCMFSCLISSPFYSLFCIFRSYEVTCEVLSRGRKHHDQYSRHVSSETTEETIPFLDIAQYTSFVCLSGNYWCLQHTYQCLRYLFVEICMGRGD